ncbi:MAG: glycosyltransferase [Planctomycetaceae bacterium]|jgi:glycosyltransferase involved in cell wall biosynthesis|nr:glycosyltransferase [Planctomycetaceae bacterium]
MNLSPANPDNSGKIRVALCTTELGIGGAERMFTELAVRVDRSRFEVSVFCMKPFPARGILSCLPLLKNAGVEVHSLEIAGLYSLMTGIRQLRLFFQKFKPHVCQSFLFHANCISRIAAHSAGVRHIFSGIRVAEREKKWHLLADYWSHSLVEKYVCVSQSVSRFTELQGHIPRQKLLVIPNGLQVSDFFGKPQADLTEFGCRPESTKIISIGRLHRQKGIDWLLETTPEWLGNHPDRELLIVGTGSEESRLKETARKLPFSDRIHFCGWREDVPELLAASDIMVLPSRWEGMPNVVLQAMAAGLPVLATRVEGVEELLGDDLAERQTSPFGDTKQWCRKIEQVLIAAKELGIKNRQRVEEHFTIEKMVSAYEELWWNAVHKTDGTD